MDTDLTLNTQNILALTAIITLVLLSGIGGYYLAQTDTTTTQDNTVEFNSTDLLNSHQNELNTTQPYSITITAEKQPTNNTTNDTAQLYQQTITVDNQQTHITTTQNGNTTELWVTPDKSLQYNQTTGETTQFDRLDLPTNIQTQSTLIKQILLSGTYEYTQVSVTNPSQFNLTQITDKNQLLYAYPALSGQDNGTISEVSINGQYQNGVISKLNGQFNYTPPTENPTTKTYTFTLNLQRPLPPIEPPQWTQNTTNTTNTTNALQPLH